MEERWGDIPGALSAWRQALGEPWVQTDAPMLARYARTTSAGSADSPLAVLLPESTAQVQALVRIAAQHRIPLYPISRGRNWGYGDASPPGPGQAVVDLSRMNRIVEVNRDLAYAVIEPGVTQQQLWSYLQEHRTGLWMDATGAGLEASLVGNTLDRGFGHTAYGDHFLTACGMEVVLADGQVLHTGFGHYPGAKAHRVYRYGVGPFLDGLFCQSNLGIVTQIGLWLMPQPEDFCAFFFAVPRDEELAELIDRLAPLRRQGLLTSAIHIANDLRTFSARTRYPWDMAANQTPLPAAARQELRRRYGVGAWNGAGAIYGSSAMVGDVRRRVAKLLRDRRRGWRCHFLTDRRLGWARWGQRRLAWMGLGSGLAELLSIIEPIYGLLQGKPSDEPLSGAAWRVRDSAGAHAADPLDTFAGLIWVSPVLPLTGQAAREVMDVIDPIYHHHGFEALATFTMISARAMMGVTNIAFDRRWPEEAARAGKCYDQLVAALLAAGYVPYRTGHAGYGKLRGSDDPFWQVVDRLKDALDPQRLIAPGRYGL